MLSYNRKRKNEFFTLAKKLDDDSLTTARLAYVRGDATEEQTRAVEELQAKAAQQGIKMPPLFQDDGVTPWTLRTSDGIALKQQPSDDKPEKPKKKQGWKEWLMGNLKREEEGDDYGTSEARFGYESLSEEDDSGGMRESDIVRAVEDKQAWIKEKAKEAFEKEKENRHTGGPLDRMGINGAKGQADAKKEGESGGKKGWW
ncbi:uncharacterized protein MKZ38_005730 [Zalerion maritima]|uniref:Uncharacterized protein n=1 Tax=Zalerion maritima TaxID=339359 RepID=A0AAD5WNU1_9PEZI|nr:uncharacterized protein MKZ38_005730 [Zalerion maritima]